MRGLIVLAVALLWLVANSSLAQLTPVGDELQVSITGVFGEALPAAAMTADGAAVVVWQNGRRRESILLGQRFDRSGGRRGSVFEQRGWCYARRPSVAMAASGEFVLAWEGLINCWDYGFNHGVFGQRHGDAGEAPGVWFSIETESGAAVDPAVAMSPTGELVAVWSTDGETVARRFSSAGARPGAPTIVSRSGKNPVAGMASDGTFAVVWATGGERAIDGQRYSADGALRGRKLRIDAEVDATVSRPALAMAADGSFAVAWRVDRGLEGLEIRGRIYDAAGRPRGSEILIERTTRGLSPPGIGIDGEGRVVVAWTSMLVRRDFASRRSTTAGPDGTEGAAVLASVFDGEAQRVGGKVPVSAGPATLARPAVAVAANGSAMVAWQRGSNVFARRFLIRGGQGEPTGAVDRDGDGVPDATDNCPTTSNFEQTDANGDGHGDDCVSPDAVIAPTARIGANPVIGAATVIEDDVTIGHGAILGEHTLIQRHARAGDALLAGDFVVLGVGSKLGDGVSLGEGARLEGGVTIGHGVTIGERAHIKRTARIDDRAGIGPWAVVLPGARIGTGATVEMGAVIGRRAVVSPGAVVPAGTSVPPGVVFP